MDNKLLRIAIGSDLTYWHDKFAEAIERKIKAGLPLYYQIVNLENSNWLEEIDAYDLIIWKPDFMGPRIASIFKEKIYFVENFMSKIVIPNFNTIWHFESKIAQSYIFRKYKIPTPQTKVSFDFHDAIDQLDAGKMPLVLKKYYGAGSKNVWLSVDKKTVMRYLYKTFCQQLWREAKNHKKSNLWAILFNINKGWLWAKVKQKIMRDELDIGVIYWQDFIPKNLADLRITVIGNKYAFGFWRKNRLNDFRASGSGRIDYQTPIPELPIRACLKISNDFGFDSMAYDILFDKNDYKIVEMSYAYIDSAIYNCNGYYELLDNCNLRFEEGHVWPQNLWIEWALYRARLILK